MAAPNPRIAPGANRRATGAVANEYPVTPPAAAAAWTLAAVMVLPALVVAGLLLVGVPPEQAQAPWLAMPLLAAAAVLMAWAYRRRRAVFDGRMLAVTATLFHRRVARDAIDLANARVVDLAEHTALRPRWRLFGMGLPGYRAGWYTLPRRQRGFCLVTDTRRVLWLPLRAGGGLLLSLERPQALLDALRGSAG